MMLKCGEVKQAVSDMMQNGASDPPLTFTTDIAKTILPHYLKLQQTLANDDLSASQANLKAMMKEVGHSGRLPDLLHSMLAGTDLNAIRRPHFEVLSNSLIQAIKTHANAFSEKLYLMHCPMVYDDRGADWIQNSEELTNPYWGDEMLYCGEVKGLLTGQDRK
jgi:Cu(I)/Ag(I) efflux system membrane fusion protein